ncbi:hypothetical protein BDV26DRAFT_273815 [Aspergillus bertholletiae]|uniref:Uncharacterized protein n=1 Tax=Aspergillus bertholletiae TaxID=1226010 RepID=A0A5N7ATH1_9EURO|nr:hypothetical protein BDV26DRAFT_273815 [Aspergillus bertholletiae]
MTSRDVFFPNRELLWAMEGFSSRYNHPHRDPRLPLHEPLHYIARYAGVTQIASILLCIDCFGHYWPGCGWFYIFAFVGKITCGPVRL